MNRTNWYNFAETKITNIHSILSRIFWCTVLQFCINKLNQKKYMYIYSIWQRNFGIAFPCNKYILTNSDTIKQEWNGKRIKIVSNKWLLHNCEIDHHSHSIVAGGFVVKSYKTREIPGTWSTSVTILCTTCKSNVCINPLKKIYV